MTMMMKLDEVLDNIAKLLLKNKTVNDREVVDYLRVLGEKKNFVSLLKKRIKDLEALKDIASKSYFHSNGFDKIILSNILPNHFLRMHIWGITSKKTCNFMGDIHNHYWDFSSIMVNGSYTSEYFVISEKGKKMEKYQYIAEADRYSLKHLGQEKFQCVQKCYMSEGSFYTQSQSFLHKVSSAPDYLTITLVLQGPNLTNFNEIYTEEKVDISKTLVDVERMTVNELSKKLNYVLEYLN